MEYSVQSIDLSVDQAAGLRRLPAPRRRSAATFDAPAAARMLELTGRFKDGACCARALIWLVRSSTLALGFTYTSTLVRAFICFALALVATVPFAGHRVDAQNPTSYAADAALGGGIGKGGAFFPRDLIGAELGFSIRRWQSSQLGSFGEVSMDWFGVGPHDALCLVGPGGRCLDAYPSVAGPAVVIGLIARRTDQRLEMRMGFGGAAYVVDGPRVGAAISQIDAAAFPAAHLGLVAGARWIVIPRYRGNRLSVLPWTLGIRVR
jgi:hypothetical protein